MTRKSVVFITFLCSLSLVYAHETTIPCLILSGKEENELAVDLAEYKRISFGPETMTISNPNDPEADIMLLYAAYNRLEFGNTNPNVSIEETEVESFSINYSKEEMTLNIQSPDDNFEIGIFNLSGTLIAKSKSKQTSVSQLPSGVYIAVAIGSTRSISLKFIK